ncbi:1-deoxy-D-xylulose-5-phosphate reductoisomerase [bacterium]|nr:1-deoxy-D-xylulose-5-phosphate reductoisomerase [bacterium]MBU2600015.1 1-deoxy-D-xylulose-5-phosphate reductoisomerase [bacterium]
MKRLSILGSTGSIGRSTLKVVDNLPSQFKVYGLTTFQNIELLEEQIKKYQPKAVAVTSKEKANLLRKKLGKISQVEIYEGLAGVCEVASLKEVNLVISGIAGSIGLMPTLEAIKCNKDIALANKEVLVMAGKIVMNLVRQHQVNLLPLDSEHSAIFQCLMGQKIEEVKRLILTASGGPFRKKDKNFFDRITPFQALNHPRWKMGKKISVDSATLMNKGLEVIEATHLFNMPASKISVLIHPQSIIHSLVEFIDGTVLAQLGIPDMQIPIAFALTYPKRYKTNLPDLNLTQVKELTFFEPDFEKFPALKLCLEVAKIGGSLPCVLNAANEVWVEEFLNHKISFKEIPKVIEKVLSFHQTIENPDLDEILKTDQWAREKTAEIIKKLKER